MPLQSLVANSSGSVESALCTLAISMRLLSGEVTADIMGRVEGLSRSDPELINLGVGQPNWSPAPHIIEAAIKALRDWRACRQLHGRLIALDDGMTDWRLGYCVIPSLLIEPMPRLAINCHACAAAAAIDVLADGPHLEGQGGSPAGSSRFVVSQEA
jgi:aspartate/methionine/tyrosine aminotransferase